MQGKCTAATQRPNPNRPLSSSGGGQERKSLRIKFVTSKFVIVRRRRY